MALRNAITRRSLLAGLAAAAVQTLATAQTDPATPEAFSWPEPIELGNGIAVLDWRPFPTPDQPRFIAEIKNTGREAVDAPSVGLTFQNGSAADGFAWGDPWHSTLAPGQSTFVLGVLDVPDSAQSLLDSATWLLCNDELSREKSKQSPAAQMEWSDVRVDVRERAGRIDAVLTNTGDQVARAFSICGLIRDTNHRIVGSNVKTNVSSLGAQQSKEFTLWVLPYDFGPLTDNPANPYYLLEPGDDWTIELTVDTRSVATNPGCPAVMPWNR